MEIATVHVGYLQSLQGSAVHQKRYSIKVLIKPQLSDLILYHVNWLKTNCFLTCKVSLHFNNSIVAINLRNHLFYTEKKHWDFGCHWINWKQCMSERVSHFLLSADLLEMLGCRRRKSFVLFTASWKKLKNKSAAVQHKVRLSQNCVNTLIFTDFNFGNHQHKWR